MAVEGEGGDENLKSGYIEIGWTTPKASEMGMRTPDMEEGDKVVGKKEGEMWEAPKKDKT